MARSAKPGGSSSNHNESRVQLRVPLAKQTWLCSLLRRELAALPNVTGGSVLLLQCQDTPSQQQNRERVKKRLIELLLNTTAAAAKKPQPLPLRERISSEKQRLYRQQLLQKKRENAYRRQCGKPSRRDFS